MYEAHYGFSAKPFKLIPDPSFYFGSKQHARARSYLEYGVSRNEGFIVITGEIGAGKTTVLRSLIDSLDSTRVVVGHLVTTQLNDEDVLRMVAAAFGIALQGANKATLLGNIEAFLITQATQGKRCLLVVDEAQNLTAGAVEELRMLSNFQMGNESLLQSFLVGQPEFRQILAQPNMEQFRQRVAATCHIGPLDAQDLQAYITHRLRAAGAQEGSPTFEEGVFELLYGATGGVPRRINTLMDRLLLSGFLRDEKHFELQHVQEVVAELRGESHQPAAPLHVPLAAVDLNAVPVLNEVIKVGRPTRRLNADTAGRLLGQLERDQAEELHERLGRLEEATSRVERLQERQMHLLRELIQALQAPSPSAAEDAIALEAQPKRA